MKNRDDKEKKERAQIKYKYPRTLGLRMLSFTQRRLAPILESIQRKSREEFLAPKYRFFLRDSVQSERQSINRGSEKQDLALVYHPVLLNVNANKTKRERPRPYQETTLTPRILNRFSYPSMLSSSKKGGTRKEKPYSDQGTTLTPRLLKLFSRWLSVRLPLVQIHQNDMSDKLLRERRADAMTVGTDMYFRTGKFDLRSARGLGLVGHELTHVAQQQTGDWRYTGKRISSEQAESSAIDNERFILRNANMFSQQEEMTSAVGSLPVSSASSGTESVTPMLADASRNISESSDETLPPFTSMAVTEGEMTRIKEEVYRDLMLRMKTEFERGA